MKLFERKSPKFALVFAIALVGVFFTACKDEEVNAETAGIETAKAVAQALSSSQEAYLVTEQLLFSSSIARENTACPNFSIDTTKKALRIDYGTGCTDIFGNDHAGAISIGYKGRPRTFGSELYIGFENYVDQGYTLDGDLTSNLYQSDAQGNVTFNMTVSNASLTYPDGDKYTFEYTYTYKQIAGAKSKDFFAIVYEVTASGSGTNPDGTSYTYTTTTPLVLKASCLKNGLAATSAGVISIQLSELTAPLTVDFGAGACDAEATIGYREKVETINLRP